MLWSWSFGLLFGLWFLIVSYATTLASGVIFLAILLIGEVVFAVVVLETEILGMIFRCGFAFTVRLWGGFVFFGRFHLVLVDNLTFDRTFDLGFLLFLTKSVLHAFEVLIVLWLVCEIVFLNLKRTWLPPYDISVILLGFNSGFSLDVFIDSLNKSLTIDRCQRILNWLICINMIWWL